VMSDRRSNESRATRSANAVLGDQLGRSYIEDRRVFRSSSSQWTT
jgi:hypothetical protein